MDKLILPAAPYVYSGINKQLMLKPQVDYQAVYYFFDRLARKKIFQVRAIISKPRRARSTGEDSQNTKLYHIMRVICVETGNDIDDVKLYLKRRAMRRGWPPMTDENDNIVHSLNDGEVLPMSEADADTQQEHWLIEEAKQLASELGIIIPEKDDV